MNELLAVLYRNITRRRDAASKRILELQRLHRRIAELDIADYTGQVEAYNQALAEILIVDEAQKGGAPTS